MESRILLHSCCAPCSGAMVEEMVNKLKEIINADKKLSINAKELAKSKFELESIQKTFWKH